MNADDLLVKARALNRELLPTTVRNAVFQVRRYRELVDGLIALCEERGKALADLLAATDAYDNGSDVDEAVQWYFDAKKRARKVCDGN